MESPFESLLLSDQYVSALENRAFREGLLAETDFKLSMFALPQSKEPLEREETVLDLICLYDGVVGNGNRFSFGGLNDRYDLDVVSERGDLIREISIAQRSAQKSSPSIPGFSITKSEFAQLQFLSAREAEFLLRRDIDFLIEDARRMYESEVPRKIWKDQFLLDVEIAHSAIKRYIKFVLPSIIDFFDHHFHTGVYNHRIDLYEIELLLRREFLEQFKYFMKSRRFSFYFEYLQDTYANFYENSFISRYGTIEVAYERPPISGSAPSLHSNITEISRVIRVDLSDVCDFFPLPRTIDEAIDFRHHEKMSAFKLELQNWLAALSRGDRLQERIRKDLSKANRDLKRLKSWRDLKSRPLFFGVKTSLSLIPFVGNAIAAVDVIDYFYERRTQRRWGWVVTPASRLDA